MRPSLRVKVVVHAAKETGKVIEAPTTGMIDRLKVPRSDRSRVVPLANASRGIAQTLEELGHRSFIIR